MSWFEWSFWWRYVRTITEFLVASLCGLIILVVLQARRSSLLRLLGC